MLRTWLVLISESYKKKATPRAEQTDNIGSSGCGQCERVKATLVKYCSLFPCPILIFVLRQCCLTSSFENYIKSTKYSKYQIFFWLILINSTSPSSNTTPLMHTTTTDACRK